MWDGFSDITSCVTQFSNLKNGERNISKRKETLLRKLWVTLCFLTTSGNFSTIFDKFHSVKFCLCHRENLFSGLFSLSWQDKNLFTLFRKSFAMMRSRAAPDACVFPDVFIERTFASYITDIQMLLNTCRLYLPLNYETRRTHPVSFSG